MTSLQVLCQDTGLTESEVVEAAQMLAPHARFPESEYSEEEEAPHAYQRTAPTNSSQRGNTSGQSQQKKERPFRYDVEGQFKRGE